MKPLTDLELATAFRKLHDELRARGLITDVYERNARVLCNAIDKQVLQRLKESA